jgi:hypothetical protein
MPKEGDTRRRSIWEGCGASILARGVARGGRFVMGDTRWAIPATLGYPSRSQSTRRLASGVDGRWRPCPVARCCRLLLSLRRCQHCVRSEEWLCVARSQWPSARTHPCRTEPVWSPPDRPLERHPALLRQRRIYHCRCTCLAISPTLVATTGAASAVPSPAVHRGRGGDGPLRGSHHHRARRGLLVQGTDLGRGRLSRLQGALGRRDP